MQATLRIPLVASGPLPPPSMRVVDRVTVKVMFTPIKVSHADALRLPAGLHRSGLGDCSALNRRLRWTPSSARTHQGGLFTPLFTANRISLDHPFAATELAVRARISVGSGDGVKTIAYQRDVNPF